MSTPIPIDDGDNGDWIKAGWDLWTRDWRLIDNVPDLLDYIAESGMTVAHFMTLPVYRLNVERMPWLNQLAQFADADLSGAG